MALCGDADDGRLLRVVFHWLRAVDFFCQRDLQGLMMLALGGYAAWRFYRTALNNTPRDYTPDRLPEFLLS